MQFLTFIIPTILKLYISILLLRIWLQLVNADFYHPFSQFVVKTSNSIICQLLRRVIPAIGNIDTATLLVAYILTLVNIVFMIWATNTLALISIVLLPMSLIQLLTYAGQLVFWLILVRAMMSWINQGSHYPIDYLLIQLTEPLMSPIRRIIPAMGGLDFSAMIVILMIIAFHYLCLDIMILLIKV